MKNKNIKYTDEPIGQIKILKDFLPSPENLVEKKIDTVKVTIALSRKSLNFFKHQAKSAHTPYQKMIRILLDQYTDLHA